MSVKSIRLNALAGNIFLPIAALLCVLFGFFAVKWYLANTVSARAEQTERVAPADLAQFAADLAPADPQSYYALAVLHEKSFVPDDLPKSLAEFEKAAALSPNDFRLWLALGRARERSGDAGGAETALRKSLALAPNYAQVQWALGNVLLRNGNAEAGFAEIRKAFAGDSSFAVPAISTAWQIFDGDVAKTAQAIGDAPQIKSAFAAFLAQQKLYDEAFKQWNALSETDKKETFRPNTEELSKHLLQAKKFRDALIVQSQIVPEAEKAAFEKITNPGFEANVKPANAGVFEWQIAEGLQPTIGFDDIHRHGGNRSLVIAFNSTDGKDFRGVQQTIVVAPNKNYRFGVFCRTELRTSATFKWEIADAADGKILASTGALASSADWSPLATAFTTSPTTEAVVVRLAREQCKSLICPVTGKVWFDDFSLE